jgi:tRNA(Ile)-lysidine synthase TilS/MesJ
MVQTMKTCSNCVLPESFPGISFSNDGVCRHCLADENSPARENVLKKKYFDKFFRILEQVKTSRSVYDAVMAYSGGKDSSYILTYLSGQLGLRVLAVTFDHGFVSPRANSNILEIVGKANVDHITIRPNREALFRAFRESIIQKPYSMKTLQRASSICNTCMYLVKSFLLKTAVEMEIPSIVYGWSPGQIPIQSSVAQLNSSMIRQTQQALSGTLGKVIGDELRSIMLQERHFKALERGDAKLSSIYNFSPLAFIDYSEEKVVEDLKPLGWVPPEDTDPNSTNCLLNSFANYVHQQQYGFHPYALEIANLVRMGYMTREDGLAKLDSPSDRGTLDRVRQQLGIEDREF